MITHGWIRWQGRGAGHPEADRLPDPVRYAYPEVAAWGATIFELVGGLFLIVGVLTPIVGLGRADRAGADHRATRTGTKQLATC